MTDQPGVGSSFDWNGDGVSDGQWVDLNNDGTADAVVATDPITGLQTVLVESADGSHFDTAFVDTDGDQKVDAEFKLDDAGNWQQVALESASTDSSTDTNSTSEPANPTDEEARLQYEASFWQQQTENGFCGPTAVAMVVSEALGHNVNASEFVQKAIALQTLHGTEGNWSGMYAADVASLLDSYNVPATLYTPANETEALNDLTVWGDDGNHGIIAFVDGHEIWGDAADTGDVTPNHFVVVDYVDANYVYLNDSGTPNGKLERVPKDVFMNAWADSGYQLVETDQPLPGPAVTSDTDVQTQSSTAADTQQPWAPGQPGLGSASETVPSMPESLRDQLAGKLLVILPVVIPAAAITVVAASRAARTHG